MSTDLSCRCASATLPPIGAWRRRRGKFGASTAHSSSAKASPTTSVGESEPPFLLYKSRADRDRINAKVMKDKRLAKLMELKSLPFDAKRIIWGGFKTV